MAKTRAEKAWAKIKSNLEDRSMFDSGVLDDELEAEIDAEQVAVIEKALKD